MSSAFINGILRRRKVWVGERANRDSNPRLFMTFLRVKDIRPADRAEPELEPGSVVPCAYILGGNAENLIRCRKSCKGCKHTPCTTLAREAVTNTHSIGFTLNLNTQLAAET